MPAEVRAQLKIDLVDTAADVMRIALGIDSAADPAAVEVTSTPPATATA